MYLSGKVLASPSVSKALSSIPRTEEKRRKKKIEIKRRKDYVGGKNCKLDFTKTNTFPRILK